MKILSSFRDPSGFLFSRNGILYRQINKEYQGHYLHFVHSGLCEKLFSNQLLIPHLDTTITPQNPDMAFKVIEPLTIPFISYPYEWSFSQLKDAALLTLEIQKISLEYGMTLKDASAYNVQFFKGRPIFIDTLSFERYEAGKPWSGYRQFCRHFLAPLALMHHSDISLSQLLRTNLDGIPLDLASRLLPRKTWLNPGILMHIHLHARSEKKYACMKIPLKTIHVSRNALLGLLDSLTSSLENMQYIPKDTEWFSYYQDTNYSRESFEQKKEIVSKFLELAQPETVWDLGANNGFFSRLASSRKIPTIAFDMDPACVELNYRQVVQNDEQDLLPLLMDLTNPSPGIGWQNEERDSLMRRGPAGSVLALALIHHLAISGNVPLGRIAEFFSRLGNSLIIEFVPKSDSQVQRLLMNRNDIFNEYDEEHFEWEFSSYFDTIDKECLKSTERTIYLMKKR
jgi:hypothetical protein